jgi:ATP-dependent helicase HrpA
MARLVELEATTPGRKNGRLRLTKLGRQLADIPLDLRLGRMLIEANRTACLREVLIIVSALAIQDPRERPADKRTQADQMHARFADDESDLFGWLHLWKYLGDERRSGTSSRFRRMCRTEYLNYRRIREWQDLHAQLRDVTREMGFTPNRTPAEREVVHRAILTGLLSNVGKKDPGSHEYRGARGTRLSINPGSALFKRTPEWVMAAEIVETTRLWARGVAEVQPEWIEAAAQHLVTRSYSDPWWDAGRGSAVANETVTLYGLPLQTARPVLYHRIDAEAARDLFIRHALIAGEWETHHRFVDHNAAVIDEVLELETRYRRSDLLVEDEAVISFFDERIPADIVSVRHFDRWWKETRPADPQRLDLSVDDLLDPDVDTPGDEAFPRIWQYGDVTMPLDYEFDPSSASDGVTIDVPIGGLQRLDPAIFDWQVPGLREELVIALIRSLPKPLRKRVAPIPETARSILEHHDPTVEALFPFLRRELTTRAGVPIPFDAFDRDRLPPHLTPTFRVVDDAGELLAEGTDLKALRDQLGAEARAAMATSGHDFERTGLTAWDMGDLPTEIEVEGHGRPIVAYPALVDEGITAGIRLFATPQEQANAMWDGTRRLLALNLPASSGRLKPLVTTDGRRAVAAGPYGSFGEWADDCLSCALDGFLESAGGPVWNEEAFTRLLRRAEETVPFDLIDVASDALDILDEHLEIRAAMETLTAGPYDDAIADIEEQIDRLLYPGVLAAIGRERLPDVVRYMRAIHRRLDRLPAHVDRDGERMDRVRSIERRRDHLADAVPDATGLVDVAWMLQELRVSLFAQEIGTKGKVSEKRIGEAIERAIAP